MAKDNKLRNNKTTTDGINTVDVRMISSISAQDNKGCD